MPPDVELSAEERALLDGEAGPAVQRAMRILVRMAPLYGARRLLPISRAHIDGCIYEGDAGLAFAEGLAALGGRVRVPTSLNVVSLDQARWRQQRTKPDLAAKAKRLADAYLRMGALPTFTCAPYQTAAKPTLGEQIAWAESNAVAYANSVIGARTNRYGDYLDICCALAGRVPAAGLHLDEPRLATVVIELSGVSDELVRRDDFFPVLGYLLGSLVEAEVAAVIGLEHAPTDDQLKALAAAAASSGEVALFHLVGITPEAPTLAVALGGRQPARWLRLGMAELRAARAALNTAATDRLDVVAIGSPHCSLAEGRVLANLMTGRRCAPGVEFFITTSRAVRELLARGGHLAAMEAFGATVVADTCVVVTPLIAPAARVLMTNSGKYAHYGPGLLNVDVAFGTTAECVESAVQGRITVDESAWHR